MKIIEFLWNGKPLIPTRRALDEMERSNIDMYKAEDILNSGFDCARSKRASNVHERCVQRGNKVIKIVVADIGDYYKIIHAGTFTAKKNR